MNGDLNIAAPGANIYNRSSFTNSFNTFATKYDEETAKALVKLEEAVRASGNPEGIEQLDEFLMQARADKPNRIVLRSLFSGIQQAVPTVSALTDVTVKISEMFS